VKTSALLVWTLARGIPGVDGEEVQHLQDVMLLLLGGWAGGRAGCQPL
jgi:hypothetical protein